MKFFKAPVLLAVGMGITVSLQAQENFRQAYEGFTRQNENHYIQFTEANERFYAQSLASDWQEFDQARRDPLPVGDKPKRQPGLKTQSGNRESVAPKPALPSAEPAANTDFFGHHVAPPPIEKPLPRLKGLERSQIAAFRSAFLRHPEFETLTLYTQFLAERYTGDDWAAIQLVQTVCQQLYRLRFEQQACSWILGQQRGLDIRLGRSVAGLELLVKSDQIWFDHPYFVLEGERFQVMDKAHYNQLANASLHIHSQAHPQASRHTRIHLSRGLKPALKQLQPSHLVWMEQTLSLDADHARYLSNLPVQAVGVYLHDTLPAYLAEQLNQWVRPALAGLPPPEQVAMLLKWLQNAPYSIDEEQFGYEKPMTLSELLYFQASDCEDRVYALAAVARHLLNIPVAALRFPNHLSAAVRIVDRWQEADPTFVGGGLGDRQPAYWQSEPEWYY